MKTNLLSISCHMVQYFLQPMLSHEKRDETAIEAQLQNTETSFVMSTEGLHCIHWLITSPFAIL